MSKREVTKASNRAAILDAARTVFSELGYGETTVRDIIRRTGLASGTFYNYFKSKEEVFQALSDEAALELRPRLRDVRAHAATFEQFLYETFHAYFAYVGRDRAGFALIRRNAGHMRVRMDSPEIIAGFEELRTDIVAGIGAGLIPDIDPDYLTAAMVGAAFEMAERMLSRTEADPAEAAAFATGLFMRGLDALPRRRAGLSG